MSLTERDISLVKQAAEVAHITLSVTLRQRFLREAADKLDTQAKAHGQDIDGYTDLLRVWADDESRWRAGS